MLPEPLVRGGAGLRCMLSSEAVGRLKSMMFVSAELRRGPRVTAARDFQVELFAGQGAGDHSGIPASRRASAKRERSFDASKENSVAIKVRTPG